VTEYRTEAARLNAAGQQLIMEKKMKPQWLRHTHRSGVRIAIAIAALPVLFLTGSSRAQDIYAYPAKGQSQSQQDRDRYECHSWAVKQTGFDPSRAQAAASDTHAVANQPPPPQGHVVKGAARGAALGAVGGAITGNAGTGAAAGAAMGGLAGGMRRRDQRLQQNQQQQAATQSAANSQQSQRNAYHRAMAACLTGRGYTVN
jgi:Glycine zipper